jgi:transposase
VNKSPGWTSDPNGAEMGGMSTEAEDQTAGRVIEGLFGPQEAQAAKPAERGRGRPRLRCADRQQVVMRHGPLDALLAEDHPARLVWRYVESMDLEPLYRMIQAVEGEAGRPTTDPKILLALWLYATTEAVGSARRLTELCQDHAAYQWICGGVGMNPHTLADFRVEHGEFLDTLLSDTVAALVHEGLVSLERVAQDGVRVRASAGAASFRRAATLEECQAQAGEQVRQLRKELESDPGATSQRQKGARERAARERLERVQRALGQARELEKKRQEQAPKQAPAQAHGEDQEPGAGPGAPGPEKKEEKKPKEPRASTTDPEARVMKMADGGFRPAFNVQFATDTASQIITGVDASNSGSDHGQMSPMVQQHQDRYGQRPGQVLVDGGFAALADIEKVSAPEVGVEVFAPVQKPRKPGQDPFQRRPGDSDLIAAWRARMGTQQAKEVAATAECVNAQARNRGLRQFLVRGLEKVRSVALWLALAHNLVRAAALRAEAALRALVAVVS